MAQQNNAQNKKNDRTYSVLKELVVDTAAKADTVVKQIAEAAGTSDSKTRVEVLVRVARADAENPPKALEKAALEKGLNGEYALVADSSITTKKAKSGTKPFAEIS